MSGDFLERLLAQAKGGNDELWDDLELSGPAPVIEPTESNAVRRDSFDRLGWDMIVDQVPALRTHVDELGSEFETSPPAYEDLFNMLNKGDPRFRATAEMLDTHKPQRHMLEEMFGGVEFDLLRAETKYDEYNTAFAMLTMKDAMREAFEGIRDAVEQAEQAQEQLEQAIEEAERTCGGFPAPGGVDGAAERLQAAINAQQQAQQAGQDAADAAVEGLRQGSRDARQEIKDEQANMAGWGMGDSDELRHMSFEERRALAERLDSDKLKRLAALVGAFRQFADAERRRKVKHQPEEVVSVTMGNDLTKLTPSEMTNLAVPELEDLFWIRWARHALLQKELEGVDKAGQGPVIVVCDESASMGQKVDAAGNTREAWSKAVSLALCDQARRGGRDFVYIGFAAANQQWQIDFPGGVAPIEKVMQFAEHFYSGNTSYVEPLTRAMDVIRSYDKLGKPKPDVVFITDDECRVPGEFVEQWRALRDAADVRCYGIQIGGDPYANNLKDLADRCIGLSKLNASPEGMQELFRTI